MNPLILEEKLRGIVARTLKVDPASVTREAVLREGLGADQLDILEIFLCTEDELDLEIHFIEHDKAKTFGDLVNLAEKLTAKQK